MTEKDYYELLEVSRDANGDEIKKSVSYTHLTLPTNSLV